MAASNGATQHDPRPKYIRRLSIVLHLLAAPYFFYVFCWHFTSPLAQILPGYGLFGGFYRFLTFCTFTLQNLQLTNAALIDLFPQVAGERWRRLVGRLACVVVCGASTLTTMFYSLRAADKTAFHELDPRIEWVSLTAHCLNSLVAWSDILFSFPRPFDATDRLCVVFYAVSYSTWLLWIKLMTDVFPYPFLNKFPPLIAWGVTCLAGLSFMLLYFTLAQCARQLLERLWGGGKDVTA